MLITDTQEKKDLMTPFARTPLLCEHLQLTHQLFYFLDESRYGELADLFAPNGVWHRQGEVLTGRLQIMNAMQSRSPAQRIRHLVSNTFVSSSVDGIDHLISYMVAYRFDNGEVQTRAPQIAGPLRLYIVRMAMGNVDGHLKLLEVSMAPEFEFINQASPVA